MEKTAQFTQFVFHSEQQCYSSPVNIPHERVIRNKCIVHRNISISFLRIHTGDKSTRWFYLLQKQQKTDLEKHPPDIPS